MNQEEFNNLPYSSSAKLLNNLKCQTTIPFDVQKNYFRSYFCPCICSLGLIKKLPNSQIIIMIRTHKYVTYLLVFFFHLIIDWDVSIIQIMLETVMISGVNLCLNTAVLRITTILTHPISYFFQWSQREKKNPAIPGCWAGTFPVLYSSKFKHMWHSSNIYLQSLIWVTRSYWDGCEK